MKAPDDSTLRALAQHSSNDIAVIDADGRLTFAVPSAEGKGVLGYTRLDLQDRDVMELAHPADADRARAALDEIIAADGATMTLRLRVRHQDGAYRHVEIVATNHLADPAIQGIVLNIQDITERVTAEHRQDIFLDMLADLDVSTVLLSRDRILRANHAFLRLTGYDEEALQRLDSAFDLIVDGAEGLRTQLTRRIDGHLAKPHHECTLRRSDGGEIAVEVTFRADDVEGVRFIGIVTDISERKAREDALQARAQALETQVGALREAVGRKYDFEGIVGKATAMRPVYLQMEVAVESDLTVLVTGGTGTGKELIAKAIHYNSPRGADQRPPIELNCAALAPDLIASTLFGHRRGAFTGADRDAVGLFEAASGGTLILDEIGEMSLEGQGHLLRVLQEGTVMRVGETATREVDVRVIAITSRNLQAAIEAERFRRDLYYRLRVLTIHVPSLDERREDIPRLSERFLREAAERTGKRLLGFTPGAEELLQGHPWAGNIRELQDAIHVAAAFAPDGAWLDRHHFQTEPTDADALTPELLGKRMSYKESVAFFRRRLVEDALRACDGNRTHAAKMLSMQRTNLIGLISRLGIPE